jgi:hypothetical protein
MLPRRFRNVIIDAAAGENDELRWAGCTAARFIAQEKSILACSIAAASFSLVIASVEDVLMEQH